MLNIRAGRFFTRLLRFIFFLRYAHFVDNIDIELLLILRIKFRALQEKFHWVDIAVFDFQTGGFKVSHNLVKLSLQHIIDKLGCRYIYLKLFFKEAILRSFS
jgi:hypothetical protein